MRSQVFAVCLVLSVDRIQSFQSSSRSSSLGRCAGWCNIVSLRCESTTTTTTTTTTDTETNAINEEDESSTTTTLQGEDEASSSLRFVADLDLESDPLPKSELLPAFVKSEDCKTALLRGKDGNPCKPIRVTDELMEWWREEIQRSGCMGVMPEETDAMYEIEAPGMNFPGLVVSSFSGVGTKLVETTTTTSTATTDNDEDARQEQQQQFEYQYTLVYSKTIPEGPRMLKWVFNKLIGANGNAERNAHSFSKLIVEQTASEVVFKAKTNLEIDIKFPAMLLKILPMSKEKAEEEGSAAVQTTIDKDNKPAFSNIADKYLEFLSSSSSSSS